MDAHHHEGARAPSPAALDAALKGKGPASGGKLDLQVYQENTYGSGCKAEAAREADEFIAALTRAPWPAAVKRAIVLAACDGGITPTAANSLLRLLGLDHA